MKLEVVQYGKTQYAIEISKAEAIQAVTWLKIHNGHAPSSVHDLLRAMEVAVKRSTA